uniref:Uncharacterized protein n=1 Tax=Myoviridae sp. ctKhy9 TaxID=2827677 RepID=A0A8S5SL95_9CAUD|nr:MAG TPA: hypothetical protein [Myoviridae sp. ctKhy9]
MCAEGIVSCLDVWWREFQRIAYFRCVLEG